MCVKNKKIFFFFGGGGDIFVRNCTNISIYQGNAVLLVNIQLGAGTFYYNSVAECHFLCAHREGHNPLFSVHFFFIFIQNVAHDLSMTLRSSHDKHATNWLQVLMERQDDTSSSCYDGDLYSYFSKRC